MARQKKFFLDAAKNDKAGDVKRYLEEHASHADFLLILVGTHYRSRPFCLYELRAFRNQFDDLNKVRDRLFIVEIDKGALATLKLVNVDDQKELVEDLKSCFHEEFWQDDKRIISRRDDGKLNEHFEQKAEHVAEIFANRYRELGSPQAPRPVSVRPAHGIAPDIFVSYAGEDEHRARALAQALAEKGYAVFWDRRIPPGRTWHNYIGEALRKAKCILVVWSISSVCSEWVLEEAHEGKKRGILIPVSVEKVELPFGFGLIQATDLCDWEHGTFSEDFELLLDTIRSKVHPDGEPAD